MIRTLMLATALSLTAGAAAARCGSAPEPCALEDGEYHAALPSTPADAPVVIFLHGAGGSGATAMRNSAVVSRFLARGYAVLAPTGARSFGSGPGRVWNFLPRWEGRDETDFLTRVRDDAAARFGLDRNRVLLAGFSAGGFMVNYLACKAPGSFAAYAPVAGGFWRPHPERCEGPVMLFHTHGWSDGVVPLEGRPLRNGTFLQGDIFAGLEIWRNANACRAHNPSRFLTTGQFMRRRWTGCAPGSALEMALYPGGHGVPEGWTDMVLDWFERVVPQG